MNAARERTKQQKAAQEISSSPEGRRQLPKKKDQTGQWQNRSNRDKSTAPKIKSDNSALERTTVFPLGARPIRYAPRIDDDETQLHALGQIIAQQDKSGDNKEPNGSSDE
jgi:hypothetical protein